MKIKPGYIKWVLIIFTITYIPIWYNLDKPALFIWDEASYANNALEMSMNKEFLVLKNNGEATLYNVKPPLVIWLQCISIWLFGANELAIRFPSAFAALLTCVAVFYFAKRNFNTLTALLAVLFLATTEGYIHHHMTRTGDLDSVLVFFITCYTLLYFDLLLNNIFEKNNKRIALMGFLVFCAFMSKSVAGFMPILGLFLGTLSIGKGREILSNKYVYITAALTLFCCLFYYALREIALEGYLQKVWVSEYTRFTENIMPWLEAPYWYYFTVMYKKLYSCYIFLLPFTFLLFFNKAKKIKLLFILGAVYCTTYFFLISYPSTKLDWYLAPIYPVLSLLLACLLFGVFQKIKKLIGFAKADWKFAIPCMILFFAFPYYKIYEQNKVYLPREPQEREGYAIKKLKRTNPQIRSYKVLMPVEFPEHSDPAKFYIKKLNHYNHYNIQLIDDIASVSVGDTVLVAQWQYMDILKKQFNATTIKTIHTSELLKIPEQ